MDVAPGGERARGRRGGRPAGASGRRARGARGGRASAGLRRAGARTRGSSRSAGLGRAEPLAQPPPQLRLPRGLRRARRRARRAPSRAPSPGGAARSGRTARRGGGRSRSAARAGRRRPRAQVARRGCAATARPGTRRRPRAAATRRAAAATGRARGRCPTPPRRRRPTSRRGNGNSTFAQMPSARPGVAPRLADSRCVSQRSIPRVGTAMTSGANGSASGLGQERGRAPRPGRRPVQLGGCAAWAGGVSRPRTGIPDMNGCHGDSTSRGGRPRPPGSDPGGADHRDLAHGSRRPALGRCGSTRKATRATVTREEHTYAPQAADQHSRGRPVGDRLQRGDRRRAGRADADAGPEHRDPDRSRAARAGSGSPGSVPDRDPAEPRRQRHRRQCRQQRPDGRTGRRHHHRPRRGRHHPRPRRQRHHLRRRRPRPHRPRPGRRHGPRRRRP